MQELVAQDVYWIERRMPREVRSLLHANPLALFLAGGFIRACVANEPPNDIDLFTGSKASARAIATSMVAKGKGLRMVETDNAFTVLGLTVPVQFIHRWAFANPQACVESFDFTIARSAVWFDEGKRDHGRHMVLQSCCDERFYSDLAAKRLVYCKPVRHEDAGGSMLRVLKFYQRGYRIPLDSLGAVIARMTAGVNAMEVANLFDKDQKINEETAACVFTGMLHDVDPDIDPDHLAHLPGIQSTQE